MADKKWCGRGKVIETKYGKMLKLKMGPQDLKVINGWAEGEGEGWVNICVTSLKGPDQKGNTHTAYLDEWKPQPRDQRQDRKQSTEDMPF